MSAAYTGPEALEDTAKVIAMAKGPSGPNDEYLFALLDAMESNGLPEDPYLISLSTAVREENQHMDPLCRSRRDFGWTLPKEKDTIPGTMQSRESQNHFAPTTATKYCKYRYMYHIYINI